MNDFRVEVTRDGLVESVHRVSVAVVDATGRLLASAGDPDLVTFWRSAAKPFQALPLIEDGVLDRFGLGSEELALACASHSSEVAHLAVAERFLARIGCTEDDLACGSHPPLGSAVAREVAERRTTLTPRWSNCSGKHAGMLAIARSHGWPLPGYEQIGHPVQQRLLSTVAEWAGVPADQITLGVDGCTTVCYALPLRAMALAYARLAASDRPAARLVRDAMLAHPDLVAGTGRYCTEVMTALPGRLIAKIGAEGVYSAGLPGSGIGVALKIEDGDMRCAPLALHGVLRQLLAWLGEGGFPAAFDQAWDPQPIRNTRGQVTGESRSAGVLRFSDSA
jgi:L-asparaginase II